LIDYSVHKELGEKVKKMNISDYFQNKRLQFKSKFKIANVSMDH